jgi:hypothetical protein
MFFEILGAIVDIETFARARRSASFLGFVSFTAKGVGESAKGWRTCVCRMVLYEERKFTGMKPQASEKRNSR